MNSLAEIEAAVESLPRPDQVKLLQHLQKRVQPTCYELVREIFEEPGHLAHSGLGDLSTNKKYLEDLGRPSRRIRPDDS
jgi:hypothetical protein